MKLHEYQAKALFVEYGIPVPRGGVAETSEQAQTVAQSIGTKWVVKAQVHAGGRGKAGGVAICHTLAEVEAYAQKMLGTRLMTYQTDATGQPVNQLLIEEVMSIQRELYVSVLLDRTAQRVVIVASTEGGTEIETVAAEQPDKIQTMAINPLVGLQPWQARQLGFALGFQDKSLNAFVAMLDSLLALFFAKDLSLLEINPLIQTTTGDIICIDGKVEIDNNALYRQEALLALWDKAQEDERELRAAEWNLNYVALDGNIGCMVNGAGLAMATMDLIKLEGAQPANFLDVGGTATAKRVAEAFRIILSDDKVKGLFVNIFGGIVRCDLIAEGIIQAVEEVKIDLPLVVRLVGNKAVEARQKLDASDLHLIAETDLQAAARAIVNATRGNTL